MPRLLNKDTQLCISLAARPSNIGTRFHNFLYDELDLNYLYKAFSPVNLADAIAGIRGLPIRGAGVSMPFKEECIQYLDELAPSAAAIASVNTIVNTGGQLKAYNTDYLAIASLLTSHRVDPNNSVAVLGSGGMAKAVVAALHGAGFNDGTVLSRNSTTGVPIAEQYDFTWSRAITTRRFDLLINATPIGMAGGSAEHDLPFDAEIIDAAGTVFDVVAFPAETPLIRYGRRANKTVITGAEVIALQAAEQFVLYTGVRPTDDQLRRASEFSRASA